MLQDPINYLYFHFLSPVVTEFERVNAYFQATDIEASEAVRELNTFYSSLRGRVYNSSGDILPTERVVIDYGAKFIYEADALICRNKNDQVTVRKVREVYGRCHSLLLEAAEQVKKRLPPSKDIFNGLSYLHPSRCNINENTKHVSIIIYKVSLICLHVDYKNQTKHAFHMSTCLFLGYNVTV